MKRSYLGPTLFGIYLVLYGSFVLLAAFSPATMDMPIAGINLAVWYGFLLILSAVVLAVLYGMFAPDTDALAAKAAAGAALGGSSPASATTTNAATTGASTTDAPKTDAPKTDAPKTGDQT